MRNATREELIRFLQASGPQSSKALCAHFRVSQPTMSNALRAAAGDVLKIGRASRTRYAARREIADLGNAWPIFIVDSVGSLRRFATLYAIRGENFREEFALIPDASTPSTLFAALTGTEFEDGIFPDLPWFMYDRRPQGFLGRLIAARLKDYGFPAKIESWGNTEIIKYWIRFGFDEPGALVLGERTAEKFLEADSGVSIFEADRETQFLHYAENTTASDFPTSSAAGEQPKFSLTIRSADRNARNVIVKYSGDINLPAGRRFADLLIAEKTASDILGEAGFPVPRTEIFLFGNRCFLESERIDRHGARGRIFTVSLAALDAAFIGLNEAGNWAQAVERGAEFGMFSETDLERVRRLCDFGRVIGNSDMHFGNLSFTLGDALPFRLAPIYDMLPMAYAPQRDLTTMKQEALTTFPSNDAVRDLAKRFWLRLADDSRLSENFRSLARQNAARL